MQLLCHSHATPPSIVRGQLVNLPIAWNVYVYGPAGPTVETEQNVQEGLFRASLRRPLPANARCERLVWGPWQRNPRQASHDGEQLKEAVRGVEWSSEASSMVGRLLEAARTLHLSQPLEADNLLGFVD
eukprot:s1249_g8.t1